MIISGRLHSSKSVLVVEDEAMIALMLEDFLDSLGHRLHGIAVTLDEGCAMAREDGFQVAILDCNLGNQKVWPVASILRERSVPFLLCSGGSSSDIPQEYADSPLLEKPYTMDAVARALDDIPVA